MGRIPLALAIANPGLLPLALMDSDLGGGVGGHDPDDNGGGCGFILVLLILIGLFTLFGVIVAASVA